MTINTLIVLTSTAGLAIAAHGGTTPPPISPVPVPQYEVRLVMDNDPLLTAAGINYGTASLLPGSSSTAVGITIMARVTTQGTQPNFGVQGIDTGADSAENRFLNTIYHNDQISNQTSAMWTSPALAFQRGVSRLNSAGQPVFNTFGVMAYTNPQGVPVSFRGLQATEQTQNSPSQNNSRPQPSLTPLNPQRNLQTGHTNGWIGVPDRALGNFVSPPGSAAILAFQASRAPIPDDGSGINPFTDYGSDGANDQDPALPGNQSPWYAMYHFVFIPRADGDATRDVTVTWSSPVLRYAIGASTAGGNWSPIIPRVIPTPGVTVGPFNVLVPDVSVTFTVPTPGAVGLLSLGALITTRRRR